MDKKVKIALITTAIAGTGTLVYLMLKNRIGKRIIKVARSFIGNKEVHPNKSFLNAHFQQLMSKYGQWRTGWEWCSSFARMVWMLALKGQHRAIADKLLSPSTQLTYSRFEKDRSGLFLTGQRPKMGSIVIWQSTKEPHKGHAGIYVGKIGGKHVFIEGNRNNQVQFTQYVNYNQISKILKLRGFITAK